MIIHVNGDTESMPLSQLYVHDPADKNVLVYGADMGTELQIRCMGEDVWAWTPQWLLNRLKINPIDVPAIPKAKTEESES